MQQFYVYHLIDPRTNKPFYVGKGKGTRAESHLQEARGNEKNWSNKLKCRVINSIINRGLTPIVVRIATQLTEDEAFRLEIDEIEKYGRICAGTGILTNIKDGGPNGSRGTGRPVCAYSITGAIINSYPSLTAAADALNIHKSALCAALNGRTHCVAGFRWAYEGEALGELTWRHKTAVTKHALDGTVMCEYDSVADASRATGVGFTLIVDCCCGRRTSGGGFLWTYRGETATPIDPTKCRSVQRTLVGIDKNGTEFYFESIKDACAKTKANATGISDCCAGRKKSSGGLTWEWRLN